MFWLWRRLTCIQTHNTKHVQHGEKSSFKRKRRANQTKTIPCQESVRWSIRRKIGAWLIINVRCVENRYSICMDGYMCAAHIGNIASSSFYRLLFLGTNSLTHSLAHSLPQSSTLLLRFLLLTFWAARLGSGGVGSTMHIHSGKTRLMERVSIIACRFHLSLHLFSGW